MRIGRPEPRGSAPAPTCTSRVARRCWCGRSPWPMRPPCARCRHADARAGTQTIPRRRTDVTRSTWTWLLAAASLLAIAPAAQADSGLLTCESRGYQYQYCNANTQGRVIMLRELSTGNLCHQGRGWGYDNNGIWVDKGCRAEFSYGRDSGGRNDAAIAAGIIGAFALGAAISSSQSAPQPAPPPPLPAPRAAAQLPPQWAI